MPDPGAGAGGRTREDVLAALAAFPDRLRAIVLGEPAPAAMPGEWGPAEVVRHLIAVEAQVHQSRLGDLAAARAGETPPWSWAEPGPWPGEPDLEIGALLDRFAADRARTLATVASFDADGWRRVGRHATFGALDVTGLLGLAVDHDEVHLAGLRP